MLLTCLTQIAIGIGCGGGVFFNTQQQVGCPDPNQVPSTSSAGAIPAGVSIFEISGVTYLVMAAGTIQSTISIADANAKSLSVLNEIYSTLNVTCQGNP
jgi:hypothetical protein